MGVSDSETVLRFQMSKLKSWLGMSEFDICIKACPYLAISLWIEWGPELSHCGSPRSKKRAKRVSTFGRSEQSCDSPGCKREMVRGWWALWRVRTDTQSQEQHCAWKTHHPTAHLDSQDSRVIQETIILEPAQDWTGTVFSVDTAHVHLDACLLSYEHLPSKDQLSSDGRGTGAHLEFEHQILKWSDEILEFEDQILGNPILFAIFVSDSETPNHSIVQKKKNN